MWRCGIPANRILPFMVSRILGRSEFDSYSTFALVEFVGDPTDILGCAVAGVVMPSELRQITFGNDELRSALDDHLIRRNIPLPPGSILGVRWAGPDNASLLVRIGMSSDGREVETVSVATRDVGAAILRYCLLNKIPMPRQSQKSIVISGDNLILELRSGGIKTISEDAA